MMKKHTRAGDFPVFYKESHFDPLSSFDFGNPGGRGPHPAMKGFPRPPFLERKEGQAYDFVFAAVR